MTRKRKKGGPEYRLTIAPHLSERDQKYHTVITLQTFMVFSSFRYELSVNEERKDNTIHLKILGLRTPQLSLPSTGPAQFSREYDDLHGMYDIAVEGLDGSINTFSVKISPPHIEVLTSPHDRFVEIVPNVTPASTR